MSGHLSDIDKYMESWPENTGKTEIEYEKACLAPPGPQVRLWILRALACMPEDGLYRTAIRETEADLFVNMGLMNEADYFCDDASAHARKRSRFARRVRKMLDEHESAGIEPPESLARNAACLADLVGLSTVEKQLLEFVVMLHGNAYLAAAAGLLGNCLTSTQIIGYTARILKAPEKEVQNALSVHGPLARSGLVKLDRSGDNDFTCKLEVLSEDFIEEMYRPDMTPSDLLRGIVAKATKPELSLSDYDHIEPSLRVLKPYLAKAQATGRSGVNILVHGMPGTGKSQLARVMAAELGCELYEVACDNVEAEPIGGGKRLLALSAAQCFFAQQRAMIVFDEVEDAFNDGGGFGGAKATAQVLKGWVNRFLESNRLPILWLSNDVECLDPAFVRRFDQVIELRVPPRRQRERIIRKVCVRMLDDKAIARLGRSGHLAPAVVSRAASVISCIRDELDEQGAQPALELLINQTLQAQGYPELDHQNARHLPDNYDPAFIHADADLPLLAERLKVSRSARLCLYGPPGTGKTACSGWLAEQLDMPLLAKRASDLLSPWVGGNERNIAEAFRTATHDGALLLIDEVDSFLRDRGGANHGWETTLVNEMLTQMEAFQGVFVASTNLMAGLDQAALRRFDLKVKFDYLKDEQAEALLRRYSERLGLALPENVKHLATLHLRHVTPGDFANVMRQQTFRPATSFDDFLAALKHETMLKTVSKPGIGFVY